MQCVPRISESEWQVMRVLWSDGSATANEVVDALSGTTNWKPKTIKTLLNRLVQKNAVGFDKDGRAYHYYPIVDEQQCVRAEGRSFLQRVYGGALMPMLASFLEAEKLSPQEIADLKRILESKEES